MNDKYKLGDLVRNDCRVFKVCGITEGSATIPKGWLIDEYGACVNPKFCKNYGGATSCFPQFKD